MKLLRIQAQGLPLFKDGVDLVFYAQQRVAEDDKDILSPMTSASRFYLNNTNAIIGINASGKTSVLKLILLALDLVNNEPISHSETRDILGESKETVLTVNLISDNGELCQLESVITVTNRQGELQYRIVRETLWVKTFSSIKSKKQLTEFDGLSPYAVRNGGEVFLPDDTSIIIAYNKKIRHHIKVASLLSMTNFNVLPFSESIPAAVIQYLDPTIEALFFEREDQKLTIHLKFYEKKEILLSDPTELNRYLSSGTVKGIVTFTLAIQILKEGGYLIVDELEDHFNKEIAATLLRFFMDSSVNINGGVLIFSTHYPEILDEFNRNDSIFITRNRDGITVSNLNDILKRNDLKKSDAYQSGILEGTVPAYEAYMKLKKNIQASLKKEG